MERRESAIQSARAFGDKLARHRTGDSGYLFPGSERRRSVELKTGAMVAAKNRNGKEERPLG